MFGIASGLLYIAMYAAQRAIHAGSSRDDLPANLVLYAMTVLGVSALYVGVLRLCRTPLSRRLQLVVFGLPVAFSLLWFPVAPVFSSDVFAYIAHGYVQVELGGNPYLVHSSAVAASPLGQELASYGWRPVHPATPYGPVFTHLETAIVWVAGSGVPLAMLLFKLVALASSLAVAVLIWMILHRVRPEDRDLGTVAYLWNPAVLVEVAGEGHNDALMTLLALGTVLLVLGRHVVGSALTMTVATLTKYVPVLLAPALLSYLWRGTDDRRSMLLRLAAGAGTGAFLVVALFAPYWAGQQTFAGIRSSGRAGHTGSTQTVVAEVLSRVVDEQRAAGAVSLAAIAMVVVAAVAIAKRVDSPADLLRGSAVLIVVYTFLTPAYWPWYVVMPIAFLALAPRGTFLVLLLAMSFGSRLVAPLNSLYVDQIIDRPAFFLLTWIGAVGIPLLVVVAARVRDIIPTLSTGDRRRYGSFAP